MMTPEDIQITKLLTCEVTYAVLSTEGAVMRLSEAARNTLYCRESEIINALLDEGPTNPWKEVIKASVDRAKSNGSHTEDFWFIDEEGAIRRFIHRFNYSASDNFVIVIWFEMKDKLNRLLKHYDKEKCRFSLWNGAFITIKELRTIAYYLQGLSYKAIAKQEHISHAAVSARLQSVAQKSGFESVPALHAAIFDELYRDAQLPQLLNCL